MRPVLAAALMCCLPVAAAAEVPLVVFDDRVAQYKVAAAAAKRGLGNAAEVSPASPNLAAAVSGASVVVAIGHQALSAVQKVAPEKPVVYCLVLGLPIGATSTVTGVPMEADPLVTFGYIRALSPNAKRVGLLYNSATGEAFVREAKAAAERAGLVLLPMAATGPEQVKAILSAKAGGVDAVWLPPEPKLFTREIFTWVLAFTSERKLPLYGFLDSYTEAGALASVSPDYDDIGHRAGTLAAQVASRPPAHRGLMPAPAYSPGKLTINVRTANALGLVIPAGVSSQARQLYR